MKSYFIKVVINANTDDARYIERAVVTALLLTGNIAEVVDIDVEKVEVVDV